MYIYSLVHDLLCSYIRFQMVFVLFIQMYIKVYAHLCMFVWTKVCRRAMKAATPNPIFSCQRHTPPRDAGVYHRAFSPLLRNSRAATHPVALPTALAKIDSVHPAAAQVGSSCAPDVLSSLILVRYQSSWYVAPKRRSGGHDHCSV